MREEKGGVTDCCGDTCMVLTELGDRLSFYTRLSVRNAIAYGVDGRIRV